MAYHYAINIDNNERRRILTASLESYSSARGWKVYDTEEEREFAHPAWYYANYASQRYPIQCTEQQAKGIFEDESSRTAGYTVHASKTACEAAIAALPERWCFHRNSGKAAKLRNWLEPALHHAPGYSGDYASEREAREANPAPMVAVRLTDGTRVAVYPGSEATYRAANYLIAATYEEAEKLLPVRWVWDAFRGERGCYIRAGFSEACMRPSLYTQQRRAIRALASGENVFIYRNPFRNENREGNALGILNAMLSNVLRSAGYGDGRTNIPEARQITRYFMDTVNAKIGDLVLSLCGDCGMQLCNGSSTTYEGRPICGQCIGHYVRCVTCNTAMHSDNAFHDDNEGRNYCETHWEIHNRDVPGEMLGYSTDIMRRKKPFLLASTERKSGLWLGWELEVHAGTETGGPRVRGNGHDPDCDNCGGSGEDADGDDCSCEGPTGQAEGVPACVRQIQEAFGQFSICKEDGSLRDAGIEIVSVPASLKWHHENAGPFLERARHYISGWPHNDCGMHVHVGKKELSDLTQGKILTFMHEPENQPFITHIAGRDVNTYCNRGTKKRLPEYRQEHGIGRYQAVNFNTRGRKTIEFRIFRSNVSPAGFLKNLDFTHAVCTWAKEASMGEMVTLQHGIKGKRAGATANAAFVLWVARNRFAYPFLTRWLEMQEYLPKPKSHPDVIRPAFMVAA